MFLVDSEVARSLEVRDDIDTRLAKIEAFADALMYPLPESSAEIVAREIKKQVDSVRALLEPRRLRGS